LLEVDKLKNNHFRESSVYGRDTSIWGLLYSKEAVVDQLKNEKFEAKKQLLELALATNNVKFVRQLRIQRQKIPEDFRVQYESLLDDKSYQTQEMLWNNFPEQRAAYLENLNRWI
jgi:aminopeptidase N